MPCEIKTVKDFESYIKSKNLVIIHFWAEWNGHDFTAKNTLKELEMKFNEEILFCSLDVDQESLWEFLKDIGIKNIPAFAYFKSGNKLGLEFGLRTKEGFQDRINYYFFSELA